MPDLTLSRRALLIAGGGALTTAAVALYDLPRPADRPVTLDSGLKEFLAAGNFSPYLGELYLRLTGIPAEGAFESLVEATALLVSGGRIGEAVRQWIEADFARGETCNLDGWELSLTECRLAAITFLLAKNGVHVDNADIAANRPLDHLPDVEFALLQRWGPQSSAVGEPFNPQPNGNSALWFRFQGLDGYPGYRVYFGSLQLSTAINGKAQLITASLRPAQLEQLNAAPGNVPIYLVDPVRGKQLLAHFRFENSPRQAPVDRKEISAT